MIEVVQWCSFCNEKPSNGIVTIEYYDSGEQFPLPACEQCVQTMKWS